MTAVPSGAPPAGATYPEVLPPTTIHEERNNTEATAIFPGVHYPLPYMDEVCLKRRIFCVGPYDLPDVDVDAWTGARTNVSHVNFTLEWNQSRFREHGPYDVRLPILGTIPICHWGCLAPDWVNMSFNASVTTTLIVEGFERERGVDVDHNTTHATNPRVRLR